MEKDNTKIDETAEDYSCLDLAIYLNNCQAHYPISDKYETEYPQKDGRWWEDKSEILVGGQKIHMITYLGSCYNLKKGSDSMRHVWSGSGFKNAAGLIWLLEAFGADEKVIEKAYNAGKNVADMGKNQPDQAKAIKEIVTWNDIKKMCKDKGIKPKKA